MVAVLGSIEGELRTFSLNYYYYYYYLLLLLLLLLLFIVVDNYYYYCIVYYYYYYYYYFYCIIIIIVVIIFIKYLIFMDLGGGSFAISIFINFLTMPLLRLYVTRYWKTSLIAAIMILSNELIKMKNL